MKVSELKKILRKNGCKKEREGRNHEIWINVDSGRLFTVPRHNSKEIPTGTLRSIFESAGIREDGMR